MDRVRVNIVRREDEFRRATAHLLPMFKLAGKVYNRSLRPEQSEETATWYNRKSLSVMKEAMILLNFSNHN
nr:hypothetical protein [Escherichia coli]